MWIHGVGKVVDRAAGVDGDGAAFRFPPLAFARNPRGLTGNGSCGRTIGQGGPGRLRSGPASRVDGTMVGCAPWQGSRSRSDNVEVPAGEDPVRWDAVLGEHLHRVGIGCVGRLPLVIFPRALKKSRRQAEFPLDRRCALVYICPHFSSRVAEGLARRSHGNPAQGGVPTPAPHIGGER